MTATNPFTASEGVKMLGEILTWHCNGIKCSHADLVSALTDSDLDATVARELLPRHAFARAARKLSDQRIIRKLDEDATSIRFQFTAERRQDTQFSYDIETILMLDKATGRVESDIPELTAKAQAEVDRCIGERTGGDVSRVVKRLFERSADVFPIREEGGAYYLPVEHVEHANKIEAFLKRLNGGMRRFPIPAGTPQGDRSVKESVESGLDALIAEHRSATEAFSLDTRDSTLMKAVERLNAIRFKIEAYSVYLGDAHERLEEHLADAREQLKAKVLELQEAEAAENASAA